MTQGLRIRRLEANESAFEIIVRWRYDAFFADSEQLVLMARSLYQNSVMPRLGLGIHEFRSARPDELQADSWMVVPSTTMTNQ